MNGADKGLPLIVGRLHLFLYMNSKRTLNVCPGDLVEGVPSLYRVLRVLAPPAVQVQHLGRAEEGADVMVDLRRAGPPVGDDHQLRGRMLCLLMSEVATSRVYKHCER